MQITAEFDKKDLKRILEIEKAFGPKTIERAQKDAVKSGVTFLTAASMDKVKNPLSITVKTALKKKQVNEYIRTYRDGLKVESTKLLINDEYFLIHPRRYKSQKGLKIAQRETAVIKVGKKRKKMRHLFIVNPEKVKNHNILLWERDSDGNAIPFRTSSVAEFATSNKTAEKALEKMQEKMMNRVEHYAEREMEKLADH